MSSSINEKIEKKNHLTYRDNLYNEFIKTKPKSTKNKQQPILSHDIKSYPQKNYSLTVTCYSQGY